MIETNQAPESVETMQTPQTITTTMILLDLESGIDRPGIKSKYNLEGWELTEMFKHPVLKGKKASRKRKMSFTFVDDTASTPTITVADEAQTDLEEVIAEVEYTKEEEASMMQEVEDRNQMEADEQAAEEEINFSQGFDSEEF